MNPELLEYVRQAKASGQAPEEMRTTLLASGWDAAAVGEALGDPAPAPPSVAPAPPAAAETSAGKLVAFGAISALIGDFAATLIGLPFAIAFAASGSTEADFAEFALRFGPVFHGLANALVAAVVLKRFGKKAAMAGVFGSAIALALLLFTGRNEASPGAGLLLSVAAAAGQLLGGALGMAWSRGIASSIAVKARHWLLMGLYLLFMAVGAENDLDNWVFTYGLDLLLSLWIVLGGGARRIEGSFASGFLLGSFAPRWSEEGIKIFVWGVLAFTTIWFLVGLAVPEARLQSMR